jgi:hypothetical protein
MTAMFGSVHCCSQVLYREEDTIDVVKVEKTKEPEEFLFYQPSNKPSQTSNQILMIAPSFGDANERDLTEKSLHEFSLIHQTLIDNGVDVYLFDQYVHENTPFGHFPSHLFSTHSSFESKKSTIVFYPLRDQRIEEQKERIISKLNSWYENKITIELKDNLSLEGSGSIVFDRINKIGYFAESPITNPKLANTTLKKIGYTAYPLQFSQDDDNFTNDYLFIGNSIAIVCPEAFVAGEKLVEELSVRIHFFYFRILMK